MTGAFGDVGGDACAGCSGDRLKNVVGAGILEGAIADTFDIVTATMKVVEAS